MLLLFYLASSVPQSSRTKMLKMACVNYDHLEHLELRSCLAANSSRQILQNRYILTPLQSGKRTQFTADPSYLNPYLASF